MARYAIGDIQGCYHSLMQLLAKIDFQPGRDQLWLVGDIINRGTGSLQVLRWAYAHRADIRLVLGNHELHAIAVAHGVRPAHRFDTLAEILSASDGEAMLEWLRQQPLMLMTPDYVMVHAGLYPQWTLAQAKSLAEEVEAVLHSDDYRTFLFAMYGNTPAQWNDELVGVDRWRAIVNAFTRMRLCTRLGEMEFAFKGEIPDMPAGYQPWFQAPGRRWAGAQPVLFGHWSALGFYQGYGVLALDTGCLWGRQLTAYQLDSGTITQVAQDSRDRPTGAPQDES